MACLQVLWADELKRAREEEGLGDHWVIFFSFKENMGPFTQEQLTQMDSEDRAFRKAARRLAERN